MPKPVDIIVETYVRKAVNEGILLPSQEHSTIDAWRQLLQASMNTYPNAATQRRAVLGWYNQLKASRKKTSPTLTDIQHYTTPDMKGFFPAYDPSSSHSNFSLTNFDTETDDNHKILEIAGVRVVWNKSLKRFEQPKDASTANFYRLYNPSDIRTVQTEGIHGYTASKLSSMGVAPGSNWSESELKEFLNTTKGSILSGHNIYQADLSWIHNRPSGGFRYLEPEFKQSYLDTYHLSEALLGRGAKGEGRNKLQNLAKRFNISAESLGIPAHAGWADTVLNIKVLEKLIQTFPTHPAVIEYLQAMDTGNMHSHRLETPDALHGSGYVTHTRRETPFSAATGFAKRIVTKVRDTIVKDIPAALGISEKDFSEGNWDKESYMETPMADLDTEMKDWFENFKQLGGGSGGIPPRELQELIKAAAGNNFYNKALYTHTLLRDITNKGLTESQKKFALKDSGLVPREITKLLHQSADLESGALAKEAAADYRGLKRRSARFLAKTAAEGFAKADWFQDLRTAYRNNELTEQLLANSEQYKKKDLEADARWKADLAKQEAQRQRQEEKEALQRQQTTDASRSFWARSAVSQRLQQGRLNRRIGEAYDSGEITSGQFKFLRDSNMGIKELGETFEKFQKQTKTANEVLKNFANANPIFNPMLLAQTINNQMSGISHAAHGILPGFMEKPVFKFGSALGNMWNTSVANAQYATKNIEVAGKTIQSLSPVLNLAGPYGMIAGQVMNVVGGGLALGSNLAGNKAQQVITGVGEGIQHRLNLLGMMTSAVGAFVHGLGMAVNLFNKLAHVWSYMPSYTLHNLTGVSWDNAKPLSNADRLMGFQAGTIANSYTQLALQQADLYTSGMFDEKKLVAAARLGIFDLAYAPEGGDAESQQNEIYDRLYKQLYKSGLSHAEQQSMMSLIKNYDPNMLATLERMQGMAKLDSRYESFAFLKDKRGYNFATSLENAKISDTSLRFGLARDSLTEGLALAGTKAFDLAEPLIKALENGLWQFARGGKIDWKAIGEAFDGLWDATIGQIDLGAINWAEKLSFLDPIINELINKIKPLQNFLTNFIREMANIKVQIDIPGMVADIAAGRAIDFNKRVHVFTADTIANEATAQANSAFKDVQAKWSSATGGGRSAILITSQENPDEDWISRGLWSKIGKKLGGTNKKIDTQAEVENIAWVQQWLAGASSMYDSADMLKDNDKLITLAQHALQDKLAPNKEVESALKYMIQVLSQRSTASGVVEGTTRGAVEGGKAVLQAAAVSVQNTIKQIGDTTEVSTKVGQQVN